MLTWLLWVSLGVALVALIASAAFLVVRGLELWRQFKATSGELTAALGRVSASADAVAAKGGGLAGKSERMQGSVSRLAASQARLSVLLDEWNAVSSSYGRVTDYAPREKKA